MNPDALDPQSLKSVPFHQQPGVIAVYNASNQQLVDAMKAKLLTYISQIA